MGKEATLKTNKNFMFQTEEIQRVSTGQGKTKKNLIRKASDNNDDLFGMNQSFDKKIIVKLETIIELEMVPED